MNKWVVGVFAWMAFLFISVPAMAGVFSELKEETDLVCVKDCMAASKECRADEKILCQQKCALPTQVTMVIGNLAVDLDDSPEEQYKAVVALQRSLGVSEKAVPVVTTITYNPFESLGIKTAFHSIINFAIPDEIGGIGGSFPGGETVLYSNNIGCNWSRSLTLPGGGHPLGCRETSRVYDPRQPGPNISWGSSCHVSDGCCDRAGPDQTPGTGVCTVGSTTAGDGVY